MPKIISYNINGIRAALKKGLDIWINSSEADIVCLQEIKAKPDQFDTKVFNRFGYNCFINSAEKPGYSGVAILSKRKPDHIEMGCGIEKIDFEGRVIRADFANYSIMSVYFPSGSNPLRQSFKIEFLDLFFEYILELRKKIPNLIISGDYNICHKAIDIHNPIVNKNSSGFLPAEREWISSFISSGFIDSFRHLNEDPNNYSWWSYRANARAKNLGWRIDYNMISESLLPKLKRAAILSKAKHSDHCPVFVELAD
jgi:exodeoxyribonuclease-3